MRETIGKKTSPKFGVHMTYDIPANQVTITLEIKKSKFIAIISYTPNREFVQAALSLAETTYPSATHYCYGFVIGNPDCTCDLGFSDAGEPAGTAGKPILNVLKHKGIGDICAIVVRYFGGVKLGTGGLVRAYSAAVQEAMTALQVKPMMVFQTITIEIPFALEALVRHLLLQHRVTMESCQYGASVKMTLKVEASGVMSFRKSLEDETRGQVTIEPTALPLKP